MSENQLAERPTNVKDYLALPAYRDRFHDVMGPRANQFMASIVACANMPGLKGAEPRSVIAAAMVSATLDLPVNPTLGMAHIIAYNGQGGKVAQFQMGYKGFIQLALRSGQYKRLNAGPVNEECFAGYDIVGEPTLDWTQYDPLKEIAGYFCAFEMLNGFTKVVYWPKKQCEAHAKRFSKAYAKGYSTPWKSDFDSMAIKTVIKATLTKWGFLSVEMQRAAATDQSSLTDIDSEPQYVDRADAPTTVNEGTADAPATRPAPPARATKGVAAVAENKDAPKPKAAPKPVKKVEAPIEVVAEVVIDPPAKEPATKQTRTEILDKEEVTFDVTVVEVGEPFSAKTPPPDAKITPCIRAALTGEFEGEVLHFGGAASVGENMIVDTLWTKGNVLKVSLLGRKQKTGKVLCLVQHVVAIEDKSMEVE